MHSSQLKPWVYTRDRTVPASSWEKLELPKPLHEPTRTPPSDSSVNFKFEPRYAPEQARDARKVWENEKTIRLATIRRAYADPLALDLIVMDRGIVIGCVKPKRAR